MDETKELKEEELDEVTGGSKGFATKTCPNCGNKVFVFIEKNGPFAKVTGGKCSCGYTFGNN